MKRGKDCAILTDMPPVWRRNNRGIIGGKRMKAALIIMAAGLGSGYGSRDIDGKQPRLYTDTHGKPSGRFLRAAGRPS